MSERPTIAKPEMLDVTWHAGDGPLPAPEPGVLVFEAHGTPGWARFAEAGGPPPAGNDATIRYRLRQADGAAGTFLGSSPAILSVRVYPPDSLRDDMIRWIESYDIVSV